VSTTDAKGERRAATHEAAREVTVTNRQGLHLRPARLLVQTASGFRSEVALEKAGVSVSAKSIMGLMTLEGYTGARIRVKARGPDAEKAVAAICELFEKKFFED